MLLEVAGIQKLIKNPYYFVIDFCIDFWSTFWSKNGPKWPPKAPSRSQCGITFEPVWDPGCPKVPPGGSQSAPGVSKSALLDPFGSVWLSFCFFYFFGLLFRTFGLHFALIIEKRRFQRFASLKGHKRSHSEGEQTKNFKHIGSQKKTMQTKTCLDRFSTLKWPKNTSYVPIDAKFHVLFEFDVERNHRNFRLFSHLS